MVSDRCRSHLFIAGPGRSGTSFLVRYLAALGLDTHLNHATHPFWDDQAQAGLEDSPWKTSDRPLPYVVKFPALYSCIDQVLADPQVHIDGVIIPMRDLTMAASSRVVVELQSQIRQQPWMSHLTRQIETIGPTVGGTLNSLHVQDQMRLLAVGFYHLIERLAAAQIPVCLLSFPRMTTDADYLYRALAPFLPEDLTHSKAEAIHRQITAVGGARMEEELGGDHIPDQAQLEAMALKREVTRLRAEVTQLEGQFSALRYLARKISRATDKIRTKR